MSNMISALHHHASTITADACMTSMREQDLSGPTGAASWTRASKRPGDGRWRSSELCETGIPREQAIRVTRERTDGPGTEEFISFGDQDADAARLFLIDIPYSLIIKDGRPETIAPRKAMQTSLRDLRPSLHWRADHALDLISFVIPTAAVERWSEANGVRPSGRLRSEASAPFSDEVIAGFGLALLPCLECPESAPRLFTDQALNAVCTYLVRTLGDCQRAAEHKGGLAPWQERRAKEMIAANIDNQLSLQSLAAECRLSISHFTKAFRKSLGQSPHQWLLERRVEQARTLLITTHLPLSEVANTCGFSDQSHFSRAFAKRAGWSPGAWRRAHGECVPGSTPIVEHRRANGQKASEATSRA